MAELEKVIYSIERCISHVPGACQDCAYYAVPYDKCMETMLKDALTLLKAQEPRVMTLEEIKTWACKTGSQKDAVYIQNYNDPEFVWAYLGGFESYSGISQFDWYGYSWRCWTSRPTDEQRKAVKWE